MACQFILNGEVQTLRTVDRRICTEVFTHKQNPNYLNNAFSNLQMLLNVGKSLLSVERDLQIPSAIRLVAKFLRKEGYDVGTI